ncbi:deoxyribose-phosphate aldolase [Atopobacter phocae]|uniref:deoxyribose-phosphate aldolase n=1 Tax=Atopobacter phocae TaxID=136492 RepID=UPI00046E87BA|nr:deoxyribose-phosphate aldolase [Atopobacter phocae]
MVNYAKYIDHTALKPETTHKQIDKLLEEAKEYGFKSVCVNPYWVNHAAQSLKDTDVLVCTVIGFPLGANTSEVKAFETKDAIKNGAQEIDMVINIGAAKDGRFDIVEKDIKAVVEAANGTLVKVILETSLLTDEEIIETSKCSVRAGAQFVKTSTGFSTGGATVEAVRLMKSSIPAEMEVKASGGVRTLEDTKIMIEAGATIIGASAGVQIVQDALKL